MIVNIIDPEVDPLGDEPKSDEILIQVKVESDWRLPRSGELLRLTEIDRGEEGYTRLRVKDIEYIVREVDSREYGFRDEAKDQIVRIYTQPFVL